MCAPDPVLNNGTALSFCSCAKCKAVCFGVHASAHGKMTACATLATGECGIRVHGLFKSCWLPRNGDEQVRGCRADTVEHSRMPWPAETLIGHPNRWLRSIFTPIRIRIMPPKSSGRTRLEMARPKRTPSRQPAREKRKETKPMITSGTASEPTLR